MQRFYFFQNNSLLFKFLVSLCNMKVGGVRNKEYVNIFCYSLNSHYLCPRIGSPIYSETAINRESGVNPEQSRCCKLNKCFGQYSFPLTKEFQYSNVGKESGS